jgi:hypothetical protein
VGVRQSYLVATVVLVVFTVSVGVNVVDVDAKRSQPLQTGWTGGGCVEGQVSIQEYCPDHKTWKRGLVCRNGQLVPATQDCPTETQTQTEATQCNHGDPPKDVWTCSRDSSQWMRRTECVDGV